MTLPIKTAIRPERRAAIVLLMVLALGISLATTATGQGNASRVVFTLQPGGTACVPVRLWTLEEGKPFPGELKGPVAKAGPGIIRLLEVAEARGVTIGDALQVQLALWRTAGRPADASGPEHALARDLLAAAETYPSPGGPVLGGPEAGAGVLTVTLEELTAGRDLAPGGSPFYGSATLVVHNTGNAPVSFSVTGALFEPPAGAEGARAVAQHQAAWPPIVEGGDMRSVPLAAPLSPVTGQTGAQLLGASPNRSPLTSPLAAPSRSLSPLPSPDVTGQGEPPLLLPEAGGQSMALRIGMLGILAMLVAGVMAVAARRMTSLGRG